MKEFTILKLYRAIGLSYLKTQSYNSAIGIFSHYVATLLQMKKDKKNTKKINEELRITQEVMCSYFKTNTQKSELRDSLEDDNLKVQFFFGKTFEDSRFKDFQKEVNQFVLYKNDNNLENNEKFLFEFYPQNLKILQDAFKNNQEDENTLIICAKHLFFLQQFDLVLEISDYIKSKYPDNSYSYFLSGQALCQLGKYEEAIKEFKKMITFEETNSFLYYYIGQLYRQYYNETFNRQYLHKALKYVQKACDLKFDHLYLNEQIKICLDLGKTKEAKELCKYALNNNPDDGYLGMYVVSFIQCGDTENYKKYINLRLRPPYIGEYYPRITKRPMWDCKKDISDKTLLVIVEQGYGDIFMFSRSLRAAIKKAKKVIFLTRSATVRLFKYNFPDIEVLPTESTNISDLDYDYHVPIMSLIQLWDFSKPAKAYLKVDPKDVRRFKLSCVNQLKFNIGVMYTSYIGEYFGKRNIPLESLNILSKIKDVKLYSFSVNKTIQAEQNENNLECIGTNFRDFYDTAVALKAMHMVVATDNVILNLAGALGVKTFGLFNTFNVGRWWKKEGADIGWYKSVRPFTTKRENEWDELLTRVRGHIEKYKLSLHEKYLKSITKKVDKNSELSSDKKILKKSKISKK